MVIGSLAQSSKMPKPEGEWLERSTGEQKE